jgi:hypothetical protein
VYVHHGVWTPLKLTLLTSPINLCLYVYACIIVRQRLCWNVTAARIHTPRYKNSPTRRFYAVHIFLKTIRNSVEVEVEVTLRLTVIYSVCFGVEHSLGLPTRYYFLSVCCCLKFVVLFRWGALSDEMTGLQFSLQLLKWFESLRTCNHTLLSHLRLSEPGGPGSRIYIPQEQDGPVIPLGTGFQELSFPHSFVLAYFPHLE